MLSKKEKTYISNFTKIVGKAINKFNMIKANDRVLVALSGGKDSLVLLETLAERRKYLPVTYELIAMHIKINEVSYEIDRDYVQGFCDRLHVPFYYEIVDAKDIVGSNKSVCFLCAWHRRKHLFAKVAELNCNKLAFGHHMDDAIETLLMNMVFHGDISSMPPCGAMFNGEFDIIRPLILLSNDEVVRYCTLKGFITQKKECAFSNASRRDDMKKIISQFEGMWKKARRNIWRSMSHVRHDYLPPGE